MRSHVKIAPTIQEIEPLLADVPNLHYVGYMLYDRLELAPLPEGLIENAYGKKLVFAYFGTGEIAPPSTPVCCPGHFEGPTFIQSWPLEIIQTCLNCLSRQIM